MICSFQQQESGEEEVPKTPAERKNDLLDSLKPLLKSCMDSKEIVRLAKELTVLKYFSTSKLI